MNYIELNCVIEPLQPGRALMIAELAEIGYESFVETDNGVQAYIPEQDFNAELIKDLNTYGDLIKTFQYSHKLIPDQNWNAVWENNYEAVMIEGSCYIRAPFHESKDADYEIVIEPQMSFGTAHHETTAMIIQFLLNEKLEGVKTLDMGCGTGVLAILAAMRGATPVEAIDNDEWAYRNALDNCKLNNFEDIKVIYGDATSIQGDFDLIIANINRNILLKDMEVYVNHLKTNGVLIISGFYEYDLEILREKAEKLGLTYDKKIMKNTWTAARFTK